MAYYVRLLAPPHPDMSPIEPPNFTYSEIELHNLTPVPSQSLPPPHGESPTRPATSLAHRPCTSSYAKVANTRPVLLLGGYSYGAMVTSCLPAILSSILEPFEYPVTGSAHGEIRMRAESFAGQQNEAINVHLSNFFKAEHHRGRGLQMSDPLSSPTSRRTSGGMRAGGTENVRRASHDSHRSISSFTIETQERVRKGVDRVRSFTKHRPRRTACDESWDFAYKSSQLKDSNNSLGRVSNASIVLSEHKIRPVFGIGDYFRTAYLLVSPLQGFVGGLLTLWSFKPSKDLPDPKFKFGVNPSLALFADDDTFVAVKKLRNWAHNIRRDGKGNFRYREVKGAGHFWHDRECQMILKEEISTFCQELISHRKGRLNTNATS
jgi:hypothetical protein